MKFELHCHSHHSRGDKIPSEAFMSPRDLVRHAKRIGLDGVALTDHSTNEGWGEAKEEARRLGILFIPGIEIDTLSGHIIGLGLSDFIKSGFSIEETVEKIREQGGVSVAPHPFDIRNHGIRYGIERTDAVEVFNALSLDRMSNHLTLLKTKKAGKPGVAGSDAHTLEMMGNAVNIIQGTGLDAVLKDIKRGRVEIRGSYVSLKAMMEWNRKRLTRSYSDVLDYVNRNYFYPKRWVAKRMLRNFVLSESRLSHGFWRAMSRLGLGASVLYSSFMVLRH